MLRSPASAAARRVRWPAGAVRAPGAVPTAPSRSRRHSPGPPAFRLRPSRPDRLAVGPQMSFAHADHNFAPVRKIFGIHGIIGRVTAAYCTASGVALVARRHIDLKRVCSCRCLP
ncbi:Ms4527A family Cys-rich leader peptide [Mycolicibacter sinensis]|uniref:Ms4527A family Cys-rich leader peptide n=2 Tax=Mycobacteriaceae TaxID=1762 RepID=UPI003D1606ED